VLARRINRGKAAAMTRKGQGGNRGKGSAAKQILASEQKVAGKVARVPLVRSFEEDVEEVKFVDQGVTAFVVINTGNFQQCALIAQGVTINQHVGDSVDLLHLSFRLSYYANTTAITNTLRLIVFQWNIDPSTLAPSLVTLLAAPIAANDIVVQHYNFQGSRQEDFGILIDETIVVGTGGPASVFKRYERKIGTRLQFDLGSNTGTGQIYCLVVSDQLVNGPSVRWESRISYADA